MHTSIAEARGGAPGRQYSTALRRHLPAVVLAAALPGTAAATPGATLRQYLQARWRGDIAAAEALWDRNDLRRSQALGIRYTGIEAAFDDNLLLAAPDRSALAAGARAVVRDSSIEAAWARFTVVLEGTARSDTLVYCLQKSSEAWALTSPFERLTAGWTEREGRYFRLRTSKLRNLNRQALEALDLGIEAAMNRLATPDMARLRLERLKLLVYMCATDAEVRALTGTTSRSRFVRAGARVVTRAPADANAAARAVVHLTLRELPPFGVPLLEDGLAAALGGWSDMGAGLVVQRGALLAAGDGFHLEALLDTGSFRSQPEPTAVPAAAAWCDRLLDQLGPEAFSNLYRSLSGTAAEVGSRTAADVRAALEKATGKTMPALAATLRGALASLRPPLAPGCDVIPQETATVKPLVRWRDAKEEWSLQIFDTGETYVVSVSPYAGPMAPWARRLVDSLAVARGEKPKGSAPAPPRPQGDPPQLVMLVRERLNVEADAFESPLFASQFSVRKYAGDVLGLFITPDSARLYDYRRSLQTGSYGPRDGVPGPAPYYDVASGQLCFRLRRDILPRPLGEYLALVLVYTGE